MSWYAHNQPGEINLSFRIPDGADGSYSVQGLPTAPRGPRQPSTYLRLDGADDNVYVGNWSPPAQWTIESWVRVNARLDGRRRTIAGGYGNCADWGITLQDGQFGLSIRPPGGCTQTLGSGVYPAVDAWYHVVGTSDGQTARVYVNGELKNSGPVERDYIGYGSVYIGAEACCGGDNFPGLIERVSIWDHALPQDEIRQRMAAPLTGNEAGLLGLWNFDQSAGATITDSSPSLHHGTMNSGAALVTAGPSNIGTRGLLAQYLLSIDIGDSEPPVITSISLPGEGSTVSSVDPQFNLGFSEDMLAATVTDSANYDLRAAGPDGLFDPLMMTFTVSLLRVTAWESRPHSMCRAARCSPAIIASPSEQASKIVAGPPWPRLT